MNKNFTLRFQNLNKITPPQYFEAFQLKLGKGL